MDFRSNAYVQITAIWSAGLFALRFAYSDVIVNGSLEVLAQLIDVLSLIGNGIFTHTQYLAIKTIVFFTIIYTSCITFVL